MTTGCCVVEAVVRCQYEVIITLKPIGSLKRQEESSRKEEERY